VATTSNSKSFAVSDLGRLEGEELERSVNYWLLEGERAKWPRALQHFENASYYVGNHLNRYYYTADQGLGVHRFGVSDHSQYDALIAKTADNKLIRPVETVSSMLTQSRPMASIAPNSDLPEDEDAAALAEVVLDVLWERPLNMGTKTREAALLACISSTVAIEVEYGETALPIVLPKTRVVSRIDETTGEEVESEEETGEFETDYRRDIQARVWSSFHLTPDPIATTPDEMQWIARTSFEDIGWIRTLFNGTEAQGFFPANLPEEYSGSAPINSCLYWWSRVQDIIDSPQSIGQNGGMAPHQGIQTTGYAPGQTSFTVIDVRPTLDYPQGRTLVLAGERMIYAGISRCCIEDAERPGNWKYSHRWHPYAFWGWSRLPGRFWHGALVSQLLPMQKKINSIDALVHANRTFMAIGQWKIPDHSKIPDGMISGIPGEHVRYRHVQGMTDPEPVEHAPIPGELFKEREDLIQSIELISASGSVDSAQISASAARATSMLGMLREEKLRSKSPMIQEYENFIERISENLLIAVQHGLIENDPELTVRIRRAAREHSDFAFQTFVGASLRDHHAVKIDISSELMKSAESDASRALEVLQFTGGQVSPLMLDGIIRATGMDKFMKSPENDSVRAARRVVSRVVSGQIPTLPEGDVQRNEALRALLMPGVAKAAAMLPVFHRELLSDRFHNHDDGAKKTLYDLYMTCQALADFEVQQQMAMQAAAMQQQANSAEPQKAAAPAK